MPLFDMLDDCLEVYRRNAKALVGIDDGIVMPHATDDRGYACGGISAGACIDQAVSGWTAQLYWLYYKYTGDLDFLRRRAMPFMKGVMRVYERMLRPEGDRLTLPVSISAEYQIFPGQRCGKDPSYQLACIHMLADALLEGSDALGEEPSPAWRTIKQKLPPYTLIGDPGEERIAVFDGIAFTIPHRHHSHLAAVYPFDTLGEPTEETRCIVENSIHQWLDVGMSDCSEWCLPWAAILEARIGYREAPLLLMKIWRDVFVNEGLATVYIPRFKGFTVHRVEKMAEPLEDYEVMQLDGTMAGATALYEMLVHTHGGITRIFPAVPETWRDVSFRNIRQPGPLLVSARRAGGRFEEAEIVALRDGAIKVDIPGLEKALMTFRRSRKSVSLPLTVEMKNGEALQLKPQPA
jgi:hypothetical protein